MLNRETTFERAPKKQEKKEGRESIFEKFRKGPLCQLGRIGALLAIFGTSKVLEGHTIQHAEVKPAKKVESVLQHDELASEIQFGQDTITLYDGISTKDAERAKTGGRGIEETVIEGDVVIVESHAQFAWGERNFSKAELLKYEDARLQGEIASAIDSALKPYESQKNINPGQALSSVTVRIETYASPEGHRHPGKNQKLSEERAHKAERMAREILAKKGIGKDVDIIITAEGKGAEGDVLDMAEMLEKSLGVTFEGKKQEAKRDEVEQLIAAIHNGNWKEVLKKLPPHRIGNKHTVEAALKLVNAIYHETIASHRRADITVVAETKDIVVVTAQEEATKSEKRPLSAFVKEYYRPEEKAPERGIHETTQKDLPPGLDKEVPLHVPPIIWYENRLREFKKVEEKMQRALAQGVEASRIMPHSRTRPIMRREEQGGVHTGGRGESAMFTIDSVPPPPPPERARIVDVWIDPKYTGPDRARTPRMKQKGTSGSGGRWKTG